MEPDAKPLKPLYFHLKSVPKCAFYEYDQYAALVPQTEESLSRVSRGFPKFLDIAAEEFGPRGYHIRTRSSPLITIVCTDPNASLELNAMKIHLGVGAFTFPVVAMRVTALTLFHRGPARIEYRSVDYTLEDALEMVSFNVVCLNMKQEEMTAVVLHQAFLKADAPVAPDRMYKNDIQKLRRVISRLKEAGLLHEEPSPL